MVVTSSRKAAVRYKLAFDKYIAEQKYDKISAMVAFSGKWNSTKMTTTALRCLTRSSPDQYEPRTEGPGYA